MGIANDAIADLADHIGIVAARVSPLTGAVAKARRALVTGDLHAADEALATAYRATSGELCQVVAELRDAVTRLRQESVSERLEATLQIGERTEKRWGVRK